VGGLFAFHMFGKDDRAAEDLATRNAHESSPPPPSSPVKVSQSVAPAPPRAEIVPEDAPGNLRTHAFKDGETRMLVAAKFGITVRELEDANPDKAFQPGDLLTIPQPPRVIGAVADAAPPANPPLALIVATPSEEVPHREFALKEGAENPYAPVTPEDMEEEAPAPPAPVVRQVKAQPVEAVRQERMADEEPVAAVQAVRERKPAPAPAAPAKPKPKPATGSRTHVVQKGDTIYNVARRYALSPNEVLRANGISDPSRLQMGQVLKITVKR
jgi:LysM repeat protein